MAIAGDIIIKLAADFAEFASGMADAGRKLDEFGNQAKRTNESISSAVSWLKGLGAATGAAFVVNKILEYTDAVEKHAVEVAKLAKQYHLSTTEVQALQTVADKTGRSFSELAQTAGKNRAWLDSIVEGSRAAGTAMDEGTIAKFKEMNERADEASKKIEAFMAPLIANTKATALENIATALERIIGDVERAQKTEGFWEGVRNALGARPGIIDPVTKKPREETQREANIYELGVAEQALREAQRDYDSAAARGLAPRQIEHLQQELESRRRVFERFQNAEAQRGAKLAAGISGNTEFEVPPPPPPETAKTGGGGGGRTDAETIATLTERYDKMRVAADKAAASVRASIQTDADDLGLMIEAKQAAADAVAKIEQRLKTTVPPEQIEKLEQSIFLAKQAQAEQQRSLAIAKEAEDLERRLGDGTKAHERAMRDLNREYASGRLSITAYNRSLKEQEEATEQAARAARRYDDNLGSLAAGFGYAAQQYARSNDLFSQGGALFTATTTAMSEGLDALSGRSKKTFGEIAADFAAMLARMALQAAVSQVFKAVFGAIGGSAGVGFVPGPAYGGVSDIGQGPTAFPLPARAGGGPVAAGQSYMVGEYGPERFVPSVAGRIDPHGSGDAGGVTVNVDMGQTQGAANPSQALEFGRRVRAAVVEVISQEKRPGGTLYARANG
jgi:hypothetical protein